MLNHIQQYTTHCLHVQQQELLSVPANARVVARPERVQALNAVDVFDAHDAALVFHTQAILRHGGFKVPGAQGERRSW